MLDHLSRWNRWGRGRLEPGLPRDVVAEIVPFLDSREVVALSGPRRAGKTTVMFQLMDRLEQMGVAREAQLHINMEEPGLGPSSSLGTDLLEELYRTYRSHVFPEGRAFLFLDEVQRVEGWERWVRARTESDGVKFFVTASSSALLSRELGTLLTGRHVNFRVSPLSFGEFLAFTDRQIPLEPRLAGDHPPALQKALNEFLRWGGFPEVVLAESEFRRERLLAQYFDDILFKDIALRHDIRDLPLLRVMAATLLQETAALLSYNRLANRLGTSVDLVRSYCGFLEEAFLVAFLPFHTSRVAERVRRPQKVHAFDSGLRNAVCLSSSDYGRVAESVAWRALAQRSREPLSYWKGKQEIDLLRTDRGEATEAVQVVFDPTSGAGLVCRREVGALREAAAAFPGIRLQLVHVEPLAGDFDGREIEKIPLWRFLLEEGGASQVTPAPAGP